MTKSPKHIDDILTVNDVYKELKGKIGKVRLKQIFSSEMPTQKVGNFIVARRGDVINYFKNYFFEEQYDTKSN